MIEKKQVITGTGSEMSLDMAVQDRTIYMLATKRSWWQFWKPEYTYSPIKPTTSSLKGEA